MSVPEPTPQHKLHQILSEVFSLEDIHTACMLLGIDVDELSGDTKTGKITSLLYALGQQHKISEFIVWAEDERPDIDWPEADWDKIKWPQPRNKQVARGFQYTHWGLFAIGIVVLLVGVTLYYSLAPPVNSEIERMPAANFRIAIADFDWVGNNEPENFSYDVADNIKLNLEASFAELRSPTVAIWGPDKVGLITGETPEERATQAAQKASEIGADLILYGVIDGQTSEWKIQPEFYLSDQFLTDFQEITGQYSLGKPFILRGQDSLVAVRLNASEQMQKRTAMIPSIAIGLAWYVTQQYDRALVAFQEVAENPLWVEIGGQELIYLLVGNAAGKASLFDEAETAYLQALALDNQYSRAYIGLAGIRYIEALAPIKQADGSEDPSKANATLLYEALALYDQANQATNKPPLADIETKIHFGRGQSLMMLSFTDPTIVVAPAIAEFEAVIADFGDIQFPSNPRVRDLAAEAYARLGLIYLLYGAEQESANYYCNAIKVLPVGMAKKEIYSQRISDIGYECSILP